MLKIIRLLSGKIIYETGAFLRYLSAMEVNITMSSGMAALSRKNFKQGVKNE